MCLGQYPASMRTTLDLDDHLLQKAKQHAREHGTTLTRLIEKGLSRVLYEPVPRKEPFQPLVVHGERWDPPVDLSDRNALYDWLDAHPGDDDRGTAEP